ncbi:MAG: L,D-transpeptidase family protein [Planctomycetes bacterium]|nr:L,D-transpeptidase family protein [Planctomycetota bacterium]MCW8136439.1 L,D-transpeptidase family protein [Planctomycetota bacterium]
MASRRSGRRGKGGGKFKFIAIGAVLMALGAGGWLTFGGRNADATSAGITDILPGAPGETAKDARPEQSLAQVQMLLAQVSGNLATQEEKAREEALRDGYSKLSTLLEGPLPLEERERAIELFHSITDELFLSNAHNEFSENYIVKGGDSYDRIARRFGISNNLLYDLNKRPRGSKDLHPGENLKVPKGAPRIVVRKADYTTSLYFGENLVRQYVVAHGKNDNTPVGESVISSMGIDPEKSSRGANDPVNEMKLRWIGLDKYVGRTGIGFHGTQYPDSIPGMTSRGCIRMRDGDVVELYDIVRIGNKVEVRA